MAIDGATYTTGTATVANGSTAVTGAGTGWVTAGLKPGDQFAKNGTAITIAAVNSNTSLTLAEPWPDSALNAASYEVRFVDAASRALSKTLELLSALGNGNIGSLADLVTAANKAPYYAGAGLAALHDQTAFGRAIQGLNGTAGGFIRATGAGTAAMQAIVGTVSQASGVPTGALMEYGSNSNGEYWRFAHGLQICFRQYQLDFSTVSRVQVPFPATFTSFPACSISHIDSTNPNRMDTQTGVTIQSLGSGSWGVGVTKIIVETQPVYLSAIGRWF